MSAVNELIVREYFEYLGYLVNQPGKHVSTVGTRSAEDEVDMVVFNPQVRKHLKPTHGIWSGEDLKGIGRAVVAVRGWTERVYASTIESWPEMVKFVESDSIRFAQKILGSDDFVRIICVPRLPASAGLKDKVVDMLREKGIDGIVTLETILFELVSIIDENKNYERSSLLQLIRLLKHYDLLRDTQMDLFDKRRRRPVKAGATEEEETRTAAAVQDPAAG